MTRRRRRLPPNTRRPPPEVLHCTTQLGGRRLRGQSRGAVVVVLAATATNDGVARLGSREEGGVAAVDAIAHPRVCLGVELRLRRQRLGGAGGRRERRSLGMPDAPLGAARARRGAQVEDQCKVVERRVDVANMVGEAAGVATLERGAAGTAHEAPVLGVGLRGGRSLARVGQSVDQNGDGELHEQQRDDEEDEQQERRPPHRRRASGVVDERTRLRVDVRWRVVVAAAAAADAAGGDAARRGGEREQEGVDRARGGTAAGAAGGGGAAGERGGGEHDGGGERGRRGERRRASRERRREARKDREREKEVWRRERRDVGVEEGGADADGAERELARRRRRAGAREAGGVRRRRRRRHRRAHGERLRSELGDEVGGGARVRPAERRRRPARRVRRAAGRRRRRRRARRRHERADEQQQQRARRELAAPHGLGVVLQRRRPRPPLPRDAAQPLAIGERPAAREYLRAPPGRGAGVDIGENCLNLRREVSAQACAGE